VVPAEHSANPRGETIRRGTSRQDLGVERQDTGNRKEKDPVVKENLLSRKVANGSCTTFHLSAGREERRARLSSRERGNIPF